MNRALDVWQFSALVEDLEYPCVRYRDATLQGSDWSPLLRYATRDDRAELITLLANVLSTATANGRQRLERWHQAGAPDPEPGQVKDWISANLRHFGDRSMLRDVVEAISCLPAPVRWTVVTATVFVSVGRDSLGWTSSSAFLSTSAAPRERAIVLGPQATIAVILHECAHSHHSPVYAADVDPMPAVCSQGEAAFRALAATEGWALRLDALERRQERLADACATSWLMTSAYGCSAS